MDLLTSRLTEASSLQCPYSGQQPEEEMFYFRYGSVLSFKQFPPPPPVFSKMFTRLMPLACIQQKLPSNHQEAFLERKGSKNE